MMGINQFRFKSSIKYINHLVTLGLLLDCFYLFNSLDQLSVLLVMSYLKEYLYQLLIFLFRLS